MAIAPLSYPGYAAPRDLDFSPLAKLAEQWKANQQQQVQQEALAAYAGGDPSALLRSGNMSLAQLYVQDQAKKQAAERDARDFAFRQEEAKRTQGNADRSYALAVRNAALGATGVYGTPIYGRDDKGNVVLGAIGKNGQFQRIDTGGVTMTPGGIKPLDTGAGYAPFDPRSGGVVGPVVPKTGEVSKDYAPTIGENGSVTAAPIPGTPAARKIAEEETKAEARNAQTATSGALVKDTIADIRRRVTEAPFYNPAVGIGAGVASNVPGSNATDTAESIKTVTANIGFDRLQRMREESPTGGALGQVAVQELESLQKTIGSLSQAQSKEQFLTNLGRVEHQYNNIMRKAAAYPNAAKHGVGPQRGQVVDGYRFKGGDPGDENNWIKAK